MAKATNGYAFAPKTLNDALKLNELETLLSLSERPIPVKNPIVTSVLDLRKYNASRVDICDENSVPERRQPGYLNEPVVSPQKALEKATTEIPAASGVVNPNRIRRILQEMKAIIDSPHPAIDIFPCQKNIAFWRMLIQGPESSPYQGGVWLVYANFSDEYPLTAPEVRFVTAIKHCNVNPYGKICHSIFNRNWTSNTTMKQVLDCVYGLMLYPETDDPLDTTLALEFHSNAANYNRSISEHVKKHAQSKTKDAWRQELLEDEEIPQEKLCKVCLGRKISVAFVPCGHVSCCDNCSTKVQKCPVCRKEIQKVQKVFF